MTKEAALKAFWGRFLTAYQENAVPTGEDRPAYPYITYEVQTGEWDRPVALSASLWYRTTSWVTPNAMTQQISDFISRGGVIVPCDGGGIYITRGSPFARGGGDSDDMVKRKILTIMAEFLTED